MILLLRIVIAVLATVMVAGFGVHAWRQRSFGVACLALWMATVAISAWAMVLAIWPNGLLTPPGLVLVNGLTLLAGPLLLAYVTYAVRGARLHWAWHLPVLLYLAAVAALGVGVNLWFSTLRAMLVAFCYTGIAWIVWLRGPRDVAGQLPVLGVLAAVTSLHAGQAAGIFDWLGWFDFRPIRQAPFVILGVWLVAVIVMALLDSRWLRRLAPGFTPAVSEADRELLARADRRMEEERLWSDPDLDVGRFASRLATHPNAVSRALSRAGNTTFYDYVNAYRIREAVRLLTDPGEHSLKIEALGRLAGFRARSTFFKLFREHTGQTPAEYRSAHRGQRTPS
jgi:AraC-like DNA-binding protein